MGLGLVQSLLKVFEYFALPMGPLIFPRSFGDHFKTSVLIRFS